MSRMPKNDDLIIDIPTEQHESVMRELVLRPLPGVRVRLSCDATDCPITFLGYAHEATGWTFVGGMNRCPMHA